MATKGDHRRRPTRRPLTREGVLRAALRLADEQGLRALTMRRLGSELGVEAMSLYHHVPNKDALHQGIVELLWSEVERSTASDADWRQAARTFAAELRRIAREHPNAYPLLVESTVMPLPALRVFDAQLRSLLAAGFDRDGAVDAVRAVCAYAMGYAVSELSVFSMAPPDSRGDGVETVIELTRLLPADTPPHLIEVARDVCAAPFDPDHQFAVGLDAMLAGLDPARRQPEPA